MGKTLSFSAAQQKSSDPQSGLKTFVVQMADPDSFTFGAVPVEPWLRKIKILIYKLKFVVRSSSEICIDGMTK